MNASTIKGAISSSTPITTALAVAVCGGAFWVGSVTTELRIRMTSVETTQERTASETKEWRTNMTEIMQDFRAIVQDSQRRLEMLENE